MNVSILAPTISRLLFMYTKFHPEKKCSSLATQRTSLQQPNCNQKKCRLPCDFEDSKGFFSQLSSSCRIGKYIIPGSLAPPSCLMGNPVKGHSKLCPERVHQRVSSCEAWHQVRPVPEAISFPGNSAMAKKERMEAWKKKVTQIVKKWSKKIELETSKKKEPTTTTTTNSSYNKYKKYNNKYKYKYNKKNTSPIHPFSTPLSEKHKTFKNPTSKRLESRLASAQTEK